MPATMSAMRAGHDAAAGDVVGHEQRLRADHDDVVDDHADQVLPDGVVLVDRLRDGDLRADAVGGGREQRVVEVLQERHVVEPGEPADAAEDARRCGWPRRRTSSARRRGHRQRCRLRPRRSGLGMRSVLRGGMADLFGTTRFYGLEHIRACAASSASSRRGQPTNPSTTHCSSCSTAGRTRPASPRPRGTSSTCTRPAGRCARRFRTRDMRALLGTMGLGHVRYATKGAATQRGRGPAVLRERAVRHRPRAQRQPDEHARAHAASCSTSTVATSTRTATPSCW